MLGVIPLYAATARLRNRSVNGASQAARARAGDLATLAADLLARIPAVHVFDRADTETSSYQHASAHAEATSITALDASARYSLVTEPSRGWAWPAPSSPAPSRSPPAGSRSAGCWCCSPTCPA